MKLRYAVAAAVIAGASLVPSGIAAATSRAAPGESSLMKAMCTAGGGGYWVSREGTTYCWLPDGTIIICDSEGCLTYPPVKNVKNTPTRTVSSGINKVAR